jgi:hypothetical protein
LSFFVFALQPNESLYEQKPEEPKPVAPALTTTTTTKSGPSAHSRFEYMENEPSADSKSGGSHMTGHVAPPKTSDFFQEYGMGNGFQKKSSNASKAQVKTNCHQIFQRYMKSWSLLLTSGIFTSADIYDRGFVLLILMHFIPYYFVHMPYCV